jgi:carboxyl-terminal processing protease
MAATSRADEPVKDEPKPSPIAKTDRTAILFDRFWKISDLVLENHVDPPTRQEMFLGGVRAVIFRARATLPAELSRHVSRFTTEDHYAAFLKENWPKPGEDHAATPEQLEKAFLQGILDRAPGRAEFIPMPEARVIEQAAANRYVGTGIQIGVDQNEKLTKIIVAFKGGPARKAGAKPGDLIVEVDGVNTKGMTLPQVVERLRGEEGTNVSMTVRQPGAEEPRLLKMVRSPIPFETVVGFQRRADESWKYRVSAEEPIAYIRLESILPSTPLELRKLEKSLPADGTKGIVLDLRFNAASEMHPAAQTADELLDGGMMWRVRDAKDRVKEYRADRDCLFRDCRLVVLVNGETRGGAEFLAAALQDNGRAAIVGEATKGDGLVYSRIPLPDDQGALRLPIGRVERPTPEKDRSKPATWGWRPIWPEDHVALDAKLIPAVVDWQRAQMSPDQPADAPKSPPEDPQLAKALAVLREAIKKQRQRTPQG